MVRRTRIGPDGSVLKDEDEGSSSSGGNGSSGDGGGGGGRRRLCRLPRQIDTFGFHLELKHFAVILLFISMTGGTIGLGVFLLFLSIYNYYSRRSSSGGSSGSSRWKDGKAVGSNIRGVGDLPKPKGGG